MRKLAGYWRFKKRFDWLNRDLHRIGKGKEMRKIVGNGRLLKQNNTHKPISVCIDLSKLSFLFSHIKTMHQKHVKILWVLCIFYFVWINCFLTINMFLNNMWIILYGKKGRNLNAECRFMWRFLGYIFVFTGLNHDSKVLYV